MVSFRLIEHHVKHKAISQSFSDKFRGKFNVLFEFGNVLRYALTLS